MNSQSPCRLVQRPHDLDETRQDRRRAKTRDALLRAAKHLLATKGFHATKIADIAAAADVGTGTFYLHFPTKDALFTDLVRETASQLKEEMDAAKAPYADRARARRASRPRPSSASPARTATSSRSSSATARNSTSSCASSTQLFIADIEENFTAGVAAGVFAPMRPAIAANAIVGMLSQLMSWWIDHRGRLDRRDHTDHAPPADERHGAARRTRMSQPAAAALDAVEDFTERLSTTFDTCYTWSYDSFKAGLRNLYEKAKQNQWDARPRSRGTLDVDPEAENLPDMNNPLFGTDIWAKLTPERDPQVPLRAAVVEPVAVPPRRAGRAARDRADRRRGAVDRRQVLRRDAGDGRGAPRRDLRPLPARQDRQGVPDQPAPEDAARPDPHRLALGHEVPRHADPGRGSRDGGVRLHAEVLERAAPEAAHAVHHARRVAPRRLRRALARGLLPGARREGAARARGVHLRGLPPDARPPLRRSRSGRRWASRSRRPTRS